MHGTERMGQDKLPRIEITVSRSESIYEDEDDSIWSDVEETFPTQPDIPSDEDLSMNFDEDLTDHITTKITVFQQDAFSNHNRYSVDQRLSPSQEDGAVQGNPYSQRRVEKFSKDEIGLDNESQLSHDSLLDCVITVENDGEDKKIKKRGICGDEDSLFDGLSLMTGQDDFLVTLQKLIDGSREILDTALSNCMNNTNFTGEPIDISLNSIGTFDVIHACKDGMTKAGETESTAREQPIENDETKKSDENAYVDFGALAYADRKSQRGKGKEENNDDKNIKENSRRMEQPNASSVLDDAENEFVTRENGILDLKVNRTDSKNEISGAHTVLKPVFCKIHKEHGRESVGLILKKAMNETGIFVSSIDEKSKFASTNLRVGMVVLSINKQPCPHTVAETFALLKETTGELFISAVHGSEVRKSSSALFHQKLPISENPKLNFYGESLLEPMCAMEDSNNVFETNSTSDVSVSLSTTKEKETGEKTFRKGMGGLLRGFWSGVTSMVKLKGKIEAEPIDPEKDDDSKHSSGTSAVTRCSDTSSDVGNSEIRRRARIFQIHRLNWSDPLGIHLHQGKGGIIVYNIEADSPFRFTGLKPGMRIMEINGIPCPQSLVVATNLLAGTESSVELLVTDEVNTMKESDRPMLFYSAF
jgi:C-terminal processing protease CtpA/Prc